MTCVKIWLSSPSFVNWDKYDRRSYETKNIQNQLFIASCYNGICVNLAKPEKPINQKTHSNLKNLQLLLKYSRLCCWSELWYVYLFPNSGCVPILAEFRFWLFTILDAFFLFFVFTMQLIVWKLEIDCLREDWYYVGSRLGLIREKFTITKYKSALT